jgi:glycosyltransferase involved in cell wall biosynthesis
VRLLHAGSIGGRYDLETTLRFSDAVGRAAGDASLTVLTRSPSAREALARLAPAASRPTLDAADFDAVPARIAEHDVGLCLLRPARANVASCPTKLPEFLASGRPVVTTPGVGDWEAFLRAWGVGVLVRGPDESSLGEAARALCRLLEDPGLAARCRRAAEVAFDLEEGAGAVALAHDAAVA